MMLWLSDYTRRFEGRSLLQAQPAQLAALLSGRQPPDWSSVRALRIDGSLTTIPNLLKLASDGHLASIKRLELTPAASPKGLEEVFGALPRLKSLRLERNPSLPKHLQPLEDLRSLELIGCPEAVSTTALKLAPNASRLVLKTSGFTADVNAGLGAIVASRPWRSLALAAISCDPQTLASLLTQSLPVLEGLALHCVSGLRDGRWMDPFQWQNLQSLALENMELDALTDALPPQLRFLSLNRSALRDGQGLRFPQSLNAFDGRRAHLPQAFFEALDASECRLERLALAAGPHEGPFLSRLTRSPACPLKEIHLGGPHPSHFGTKGQWQSLEQRTHLPSLQRVEWGLGWEVDDTLCQTMLYGDGAPVLEHFSMESGNAFIENPAGLPFSTSLRHLHIHAKGPFEVAAQAEPLALEHLELHWVDLEDGDFEGFLAACPHLKSLTLYAAQNWHPQALQAHLPMLAPHLQTLTIEMVETDSLFDHEVEALAQTLGAALTQGPFPNLKTLRLGQTPVALESFKRLIQARHTPKLQHLCFGPIPFDTGLWDFIQAEVGPDLQTLDVSADLWRPQLQDTLRAARWPHLMVHSTV